jgi:predicted amidohydrolase
MKVSIIQTQLHWEDPDKNLQMFDSILSKLGTSDLVILPEMFTTGFTMNTKVSEPFSSTSKTISWMRLWAEKLDASVVGSISCSESGKHFNRLIFAKPDNTFDYYDKRHLFTHAKEHQHYTPGQKRIIQRFRGWNVLPLICYDLRFPVWSRWSKENNYDLLIYVANWPQSRSTHWKTLLQARAIENQSWVIGCNRVGVDGLGNTYSGDSMVISPKGEIFWHESNIDSVGTIEIDSEYLKQYRSDFSSLSDSDQFTIEVF